MGERGKTGLLNVGAEFQQFLIKLMYGNFPGIEMQQHKSATSLYNAIKTLYMTHSQPVIHHRAASEKCFL
jgi:hypothetical protein